mmetsp:Transcript_16185/g.25124  ORF Transcript_16185/g.25124 Transcript_16185/m.25124 type:complete len:255 (-) Transcript_16185:234-998(-)
MSALKPMTSPLVSVLPLMRPTTPVRPMPVTTSSQPNALSFSATNADVRWVSYSTSGWAWMSRRHSVISVCNSAKRFLTGMFLSPAPALVCARHMSLDHLYKPTAAQRNRFVIEVIRRMMALRAVAIPQVNIGTWALLQHEREIFCRHDGINLRIHIRLTRHGLRRFNSKLGLAIMIDRHRVAVFPDHFRRCAKGESRVGGHFANAPFGQFTVVVVQGTHRAFHAHCVRNHVGGAAVRLKCAHCQHNPLNWFHVA